MTMRYTSVFLQLDCKYCTDKGEQKIRQARNALLRIKHSYTFGSNFLRPLQFH